MDGGDLLQDGRECVTDKDIAQGRLQLRLPAGPEGVVLQC